ncbi:DUF6151 family protein [Sulfitobacter sp.]|jgi:hypothetical protein|uniref:DUF6151 family protein n=1 Tax=Sulfitobacter sp. TaxID=1903071 RepID=UPI0039E61C53
MFKKPKDVAFRCACGTVTGTLLGASPAVGNHLECFCKDCRAAEVFSGQPDTTSVAMFQTTPDRIKFDQGLDQLAVFSFGEKNILRWHATCCGSVIGNTLRNPKIAFSSIRTSVLVDTDAIGPVTTKAFLQQPGEKPRHKGMSRFVWGVLSRGIAARMTGRWKDTAFFDADTLAPVREVHVVPKAKRSEIGARLR